MAVLAFNDRLRRAEWNKRNPEEMKECPGSAWFKSRKLATARALLHTAAEPVVVAHYLASTEEDNHLLPQSNDRTTSTPFNAM